MPREPVARPSLGVAALRRLVPTDRARRRVLSLDEKFSRCKRLPDTLCP